jgi:hypothetical protein
MLSHGSKKDFPPDCPQEIGKVDERDSLENVAPIQSVLKEPSPVEVPPCPELEVDQRGQHDENNRVRYVFFIVSFIVHAVRKSQTGQL